MFCWQVRRKITPTCLASDSRVQRPGQQHDGETIGSDVSADQIDGHTWTAISGEVVASRSIVTS